MRNRGIFLSLLLILTFVMPMQAQEEGPAQVGLRPDAPTYAVHGPYWVGAMEFVIEDQERPLVTTVWYPALNPENAEVSATYSFEPKFSPVPEIEMAIFGHALRDAAPDATGAPYPLIIFSHGFSGNPFFYANLVEHLGIWRHMDS
jgi:hypothetical protein